MPDADETDDKGAMDALAALRLLCEFGADEALEACPIDRRRAAPPRQALAAAPAPVAEAPAPVAEAFVPATRPRQHAAGVAPVRGPSVIEAARAEAAAATSVADLQRRLAGFTLCPLATTATRPAIADGNPSSRLVFVGDVAGDAEDRSGRAFDGEAGALLDRMLAAIGLDRTRCYLVNLIPWRPPGGRAPNDTEISICEPFLRQHLRLLEADAVVALGNLPARLLSGEATGIRRLRGTWHDIAVDGGARTVPLLVTYHPAFLLGTPAAKRDAWADLQALRDRLAAISLRKITV